MFALLFVLVAFAEDPVYTQAETPSLRFSDAAVPGPTFAPGTRLEVLVREGGVVRVVQGDKFGWVPATAVAVTMPAPELDLTPDVEGGAPTVP